MGQRGSEWTDRGDEVEIEEGTDPIDGGNDGDLLFGKIEDLLGELPCRALGVPGSHGGERGKTGRGWVDRWPTNL